MGSSGGGGSSGAVSFPAYIESMHTAWLNDMDTDLTTARANDPWSGQTGYNPATDLAFIDTAIDDFESVLSSSLDTWTNNFSTAQSYLIAPTTMVPSTISVSSAAVSDKTVSDVSYASGSFGSASTSDAIVNDNTGASDINISDTDIATLAPVTAPPDISVTDLSIASATLADMADTTDVDGITEALITADVDAFADQLDDEITTKILPRFKCGMLNINAVQTSAFTIGQSIIEGFRDRDVAKHASAIRLNAANKNADIGLANEQLHLEVKKSNLDKSMRLISVNMEKDLQVGSINKNKDLEVAKTNLLTKTQFMNIITEIYKANLSARVTISTSNLMKDLEQEKSNQDKDLKSAIADQSKNIQIEIANMQKDLEISKFNTDNVLREFQLNEDIAFRGDAANMQKDLDLFKALIAKDVQVAIANLNKDLEVAKYNNMASNELKQFNRTMKMKMHELSLSGTDQLQKSHIQSAQLHGDVARLRYEEGRIKIVANKEYNDINIKIDEKSALWDLEVFQYASNLLASASGGTAVTSANQPSIMQSALGGGLSGAASGAMIGSAVPGIGTGIGAAVGGVLGLASAFF